jgi:hypothetical protein
MDRTCSSSIILGLSIGEERDRSCLRGNQFAQNKIRSRGFPSTCTHYLTEYWSLCKDSTPVLYLCRSKQTKLQGLGGAATYTVSLFYSGSSSLVLCSLSFSSVPQGEPSKPRRRQVRVSLHSEMCVVREHDYTGSISIWMKNICLVAEIWTQIEVVVQDWVCQV